jgi:hypothetical protein
MLSMAAAIVDSALRAGTITDTGGWGDMAT